MKKLFALLGLAVAGTMLIADAAVAQTDCAEPVATASGLVRGVDEPSTCVWKGIPYAAPPVDNLRWAAPQPATSWDGVRDADKFGDRCMQKGIMSVEGWGTPGGMSEDCLFLNVWRPKKSGVFPVMVWVHGGGYYAGQGATPWYWGDRLATDGDLVVVTINYRLNIFGFFTHPQLREEDPNGSTGSYGTLDQVAALQWVHDNIANFGGDPGNVTIFGESAGGWSICTLLATPLTRGLFHRAILESGGCEQSGTLEEGYEQAKIEAKEMDCDYEDLECMRKRSATIVLRQASHGMVSGVDAKPHQDGYVLTDTPLAMIRAGNYNQVPFIAGSNRDEFGRTFLLMGSIRRIKPDQYQEQLTAKFNIPADKAAELVKLYPLSDFDNRPVEAYGRMFGADAALACPTYNGLLAAAKQQPQTWYYHFNYDGMNAGKRMGAAHAMEIPFFFNTLDRMPANYLYDKANMPEATALMHTLHGYVINFAKTGDPNGPGLPEWPEFRPDNRELQVFDVDVHTEPAGVFDQRCEFWDNSGLNPADAMGAIGETVK